jgi:glycerol kinase
LGAAFMAGLQVGMFKSLNDISKRWKLNRKFIPKMKNSERLNLLKGWSQAMRRTLIQ